MEEKEIIAPLDGGGGGKTHLPEQVRILVPRMFG